MLLLALLLFCSFTTLGRNYPHFLATSLRVWKVWRPMPPEQRRLRSLDSTYPQVLYLREATPPNAVILLPPRKLIVEKAGLEIPLLSSASAVYNLAYPRVPVHSGDPAPERDRVDWILVWEHWGLDLADPGAAPTEDNRIQLYSWKPERPLQW